MLAAVSCVAEIPNPPPDVVKLLPKTGDVKNWEVYPDTLVYASLDDLTEIYDGDYQLYTKNGVLDAAQQMYRREEDIATVTTHRMTSPEAARKFYQYWKKSDKEQDTFKLLKTPAEAYTYTADGCANGYLYRDKFFVTVMVTAESGDDRTVAEDFLKKISTAIGELIKPKKQE